MIRLACCIAFLASNFLAFGDPPSGGVKSNSTSPALPGQTERYWSVSPVGSNAELLTLFNRSNSTGETAGKDLPVVSLLRDTLGDNVRENDRILYVWLLPSVSRSLTQRVLAGVPFFFWSFGRGPQTATSRDLHPLLDLNTPQHPVMAEVRRSLLQWTAFDPLMMPIRASSRMYRSNSSDDERLRLEETITYLRGAPTAEAEPAMPTKEDLNTVIARLELRKQLLGGLFNDKAASHLGRESQFEAERVRSRNWELLRQCAERPASTSSPSALARRRSNTGCCGSRRG